MAAELVESYEYKDGYLIRKVKTRDGAFVASMLPSNVAYNNIIVIVFVFVVVVVLRYSSVM